MQVLARLLPLTLVAALQATMGISTGFAQTSSLLFTGQQEPQPVIVNRENGTQVQLETGTWDAFTDLFGPAIECREFRWFNDELGYINSFTRDVTAYYRAPHELGSSSGITETLFEGRTFFGTWNISDNALETDFSNTKQLFANSMWHERILKTGFDVNFFPGGFKEGVRYWGEPGLSDFERGSYYIDCYYDGFEVSLRPETNSVADNCDYTDAAPHDGWGWNPVTMQSCAPLNEITPITTTQCIDSDGDGYGWDGTATCTLDTGTAVTNTVPDSNCDYSNSDLFGGWGWNASASQSCAPLETVSNSQPIAQCIDTDGDGWGWDGSASCIP